METNQEIHSIPDISIFSLVLWLSMLREPSPESRVPFCVSKTALWSADLEGIKTGQFAAPTMQQCGDDGGADAEMDVVMREIEAWKEMSASTIKAHTDSETNMINESSLMCTCNQGQVPSTLHNVPANGFTHFARS